MAQLLLVLATAVMAPGLVEPVYAAESVTTQETEFRITMMNRLQAGERMVVTPGFQFPAQANIQAIVEATPWLFVVVTDLSSEAFGTHVDELVEWAYQDPILTGETAEDEPAYVLILLNPTTRDLALDTGAYYEDLGLSDENRFLIDDVFVPAVNTGGEAAGVQAVVDAITEARSQRENALARQELIRTWGFRGGLALVITLILGSLMGRVAYTGAAYTKARTRLVAARESLTNLIYRAEGLLNNIEFDSQLVDDGDDTSESETEREYRRLKEIATDVLFTIIGAGNLLQALWDKFDSDRPASDRFSNQLALEVLATLDDPEHQQTVSLDSMTFDTAGNLSNIQRLVSTGALRGLENQVSYLELTAKFEANLTLLAQKQAQIEQTQQDAKPNVEAQRIRLNEAQDLETALASQATEHSPFNLRYASVVFDHARTVMERAEARLTAGNDLLGANTDALTVKWMLELCETVMAHLTVARTTHLDVLTQLETQYEAQGVGHAWARQATASLASNLDELLKHMTTSCEAKQQSQLATDVAQWATRLKTETDRLQTAIALATTHATAATTLSELAKTIGEERSQLATELGQVAAANELGAVAGNLAMLQEADQNPDDDLANATHHRAAILKALLTGAIAEASAAKQQMEDAIEMAHHRITATRDGIQGFANARDRLGAEQTRVQAVVTHNKQVLNELVQAYSPDAIATVSQQLEVIPSLTTAVQAAGSSLQTANSHLDEALSLFLRGAVLTAHNPHQTVQALLQQAEAKALRATDAQRALADETATAQGELAAMRQGLIQAETVFEARTTRQPAKEYCRSARHLIEQAAQSLSPAGRCAPYASRTTLAEVKEHLEQCTQLAAQDAETYAEVERWISRTHGAIADAARAIRVAQDTHFAHATVNTRPAESGLDTARAKLRSAERQLRDTQAYEDALKTTKAAKRRADSAESQAKRAVSTARRAHQKHLDALKGDDTSYRSASRASSSYGQKDSGSHREDAHGNQASYGSYDSGNKATRGSY